MTLPRPTLALAGLLPLFLLACAGEADPPVPAGELPIREAEVVTRLGEIDGELVFGTAVQVRVGPDGLLYTTESESPAIRVLTPEGEPVRTIGRAGEGPGEFRFRPAHLAWRGDSLGVLDGERLNWFDAEGAFLGMERLPMVEAGEGRSVRPQLILPAGGFVGSTPSTQGIATSGNPRVARVRVPATAERLDTLLVRDISRASRRLSTGGVSPQPFHDPPVAEVDPVAEELLTAEWEGEPRSVVRVRRVSFEGDTLARGELGVRPIPLTDAMVDEVLVGFEEAFQRGRGLSPSDARALAREDLYRPAHLPPPLTILPGADGSVWLRLRAPSLLPGAEGFDPTPVWVAFDRELRPRGVAVMPVGFFLHAPDASGGWGMLRDELGVNYVVRVEVAW